MFVLEGTLVTSAGNYGPGTFVWFPEGTLMQRSPGIVLASLCSSAFAFIRPVIC
jgi:hypothetical protein